MSEYPDPFEVSVGYYVEALLNTGWYLFSFLPATMFVVIPFLIESPFSTFTIFAYLGLASYWAILDMGGHVQAISERDEPKVIKAMIAFVLLVYYHFIIIVAVVFGLAFAQVGPTELAFAVAAVIPGLDAELSRSGYPSIGLIVVLAIQLLAKIASLIDLLSQEDFYEFRDTLSNAAALLEASLKRSHAIRGLLF